MPEPSTSKGITASVHHATVIVGTLKRLSEIGATPYLKEVARVALLILHKAQSVRTNRDQCAILIEKMDEVLGIIIQLCAETSITLPPNLFDDMGRFAETLKKIESFMRTQQDMGMLKRFFRQKENTAQLEDCKAGLGQALDAFSATITVDAVGYLTEITAARERNHQKLLELIADDFSFDQVSSIDTSSKGLNGSTVSLSLLPLAPRIFYGREFELQDVTDLLLQDSPRVAILGPGGVGKTCLATSVLYRPEIVAKYRKRYFVSCEGAGSVEDLELVVAAHLGLERTERISKTIVKHLSAESSFLLVLDNFETPWEPISGRAKVEDFLSVLTELPHLALLVTMRGQERPSKIRWTRPFIRVLSPLSAEAARKTFMVIADIIDSDQQHVTELLALTGNLPLVVTLMAHVADFEGCLTVLSRWKTESVALVSNGHDKRSNFTLSLGLSLSSPRMESCPGALQLLSLLSLLPDGILDVDLLNSSCPIPDLLGCKSTLLRTSLADIEANRRLTVLAPVRELIRKIHPPSYAVVHQLRLHWDKLLMLWRTYQMPWRDLGPRLAGNAGNIASLLKYGLEVGAPDLKEVLHGIFHLDTFTGRTYGYHPPLMTEIDAHIERLDDNQLRGFYVCYLFNQGSTTPISPSEAPDRIAQGCSYFQAAGDLTGEAGLQDSVATYYLRLGDVQKASLHADISLSLADDADDNFCRNRALCLVSTCQLKKGKFREALLLARRAQSVARRLGNLPGETEALKQEAEAYISLGNFSRAINVCSLVRQLVVATGLEGTLVEVSARDLEGDLHLHKTAYVEARRAHELILEQSSRDKFTLFHGNSLVTIASIDVVLGALNSEAEVQAALEVPRQIFTSRGYLCGLPICDKIVADLFFAKARTLEAVEMYEKCVRAFRGESADLFSECVLKLGDITLMSHDVRSASRWAMVSLAHGKTTGSASIVSWSFLLLGDIFRVDGENETSSALFQVALDDFTRMDIYRGKAECLLRLAEFDDKPGKHVAAVDRLAQARHELLKAGMIVEADTALALLSPTTRKMSRMMLAAFQQQRLRNHEESISEMFTADQQQATPAPPSTLGFTSNLAMTTMPITHKMRPMRRRIGAPTSDDEDGEDGERSFDLFERESYEMIMDPKVPLAMSSDEEYEKWSDGLFEPESWENAQNYACRAGNSQTETFVIYSPGDDVPQTYGSSTSKSLSMNDVNCLHTNLGMGGCVVSVHEPIEAAAWIENNWGNPLLASIQDSGCCGPVPFMLFPTKPALAIFGGPDDPFLTSAAESLAKLSGFHVVIRPAGENPMGTSCVL
ncbi:hypothetical protein C8R44DRAFT_979446 [Mycena epipterygia]|nr:hypothetical protein C8R44DRAFT_979446 [Mycena epipterygia]